MEELHRNTLLDVPREETSPQMFVLIRGHAVFKTDLLARRIAPGKDRCLVVEGFRSEVANIGVWGPKTHVKNEVGASEL